MPIIKRGLHFLNGALVLLVHHLRWCTIKVNRVVKMIKSSVLKIEIVTGDSRPIFKQIIDGIRMEIGTGRLTPGSKLPSYRGLAIQLMINPNTVAKAYSELSTEGLIESRPGLGLFVCESKQLLSDDKQEEKLQKAIDNFINETIALNYSEVKLIDELKNSFKRLNKLKSA